MVQLHKRFSGEQARVLYQGYCQRVLTSAGGQEALDIGRTRFFPLLKDYRSDPDGFSIAYDRPARGRLPAVAETEIESELLREKKIVEGGGRLPSERRGRP